jgi:hypothetical protein
VAGRAAEEGNAMSLRFFRRKTIVPGLRLNLSKSGVSISVGRRGAWFTIRPGGRRRVTAGLPGTGLFWTEQSRAARRSRAGSVVFVLVLLAIFFLMIAAFSP